jgi:outer membrane protein assembly factor BamD (BamD/ComL family)
MQQRAKISAELAAGRPEAAAELYVELIERDASQVMSGRQQVDIANQLMAMGRHDAAARAYELYLNTFRTDPNREQIELILGLLYFRYLNRRQRARELLNAALPRLTDAEQKSLAQQMLAEIAA